MTGYENIANTKQDGSWVNYVFSLMPEKKIIRLCSPSRSLVLQNRSPKYWRTIRNTFGLFKKHFSKANEPKKPQNIFQTEKFQVYFWETNTSFSIPWRLRFLAWLNLYIITALLGAKKGPTHTYLFSKVFVFICMLENMSKYFLCTHTSIVLWVSTAQTHAFRLDADNFPCVFACRLLQRFQKDPCWIPVHTEDDAFSKERFRQSKIFTSDKVAKCLIACDPFNVDNSQKNFKGYDTSSNENASVWIRRTVHYCILIAPVFMCP